MGDNSIDYLLEQIVKRGKLHIHYKEKVFQKSYKFKFTGDSSNDLHIIMAFNSDSIREGLEKILVHYKQNYEGDEH